MSISLWYEKYRPNTMDEYVWRDSQMRIKVEEWLTEGGLPSLLLSGVSGTGKTSLALLLLKMLEIPHEDLLKINASRERGIEALQDKIIGFINLWTLNKSGLKYVLLDEADKMSPLAQGMLRAEIETYSSTCRFIFTANYPNKIIPALHGRLQEIKFSSLDNDDFIMRGADVLDQEKVVFDPEVLMAYHARTYPDLRKCIGLLQQNTIAGVLNPLRDDDDAAKDYLLQAIDLFKTGKYLEARKLIIEQADPEEYNDLYHFFYENLNMFGSTQDQQDDALLIIRKAIVFDGQVADRELNAAACLVELTRIAKA
jgi:replication factor C small subunit